MSTPRTSPSSYSDYVLTLDEIGNLAAEGGKPAETLMKRSPAPIAKRFKTDVCSAYLLEPDRANLNSGRHARFAAELRGYAAHGASRRPGPDWLPNTFSRSPSNKSKIIRDINTSANRAKRPTNRFWEFRSLTAAYCRECWSCRRRMRESSATAKLKCSRKPPRS